MISLDLPNGNHNPSSSSSNSEEATDANKKKTIFLIRHAESMENQRIASMVSCWGDIRRFVVPKKEEVGASLELLNISANADAPISEAGKQQCQTMKTVLQNHSFLETNEIKLVVHSPLRRAKQTCYELLGCSSDDVFEMKINERQACGGVFSLTPRSGSSKDKKELDISQSPANQALNKGEENPGSNIAINKQEDLPVPVERVVNLNLLAEKSHSEWIPGNAGGFEQRVCGFQKWLEQQSEDSICVVGHSQFFKLLLGLPFKFDNCDVYKVNFDPQKTKENEQFIMEHDGTADMVTLKPQWYDLELLHSCSRNQDPTATTTISGNGQHEMGTFPEQIVEDEL